MNIKVVKENEPAVNAEDDDATQLAPTPVAKKTVKRPRRKKKTLTWLWWAMLIAAIVAVAVWLTLYGLQDNHKQSNVPTRTELEEPQNGKTMMPSMIQRKAEPEKTTTAPRAPRARKAQHSPEPAPAPASAQKSSSEAVPAKATPDPSDNIKLPKVIKDRTAPSKEKQTAAGGNENDKPNRDK